MTPQHASCGMQRGHTVCALCTALHAATSIPTFNHPIQSLPYPIHHPPVRCPRIQLLLCRWCSHSICSDAGTGEICQGPDSCEQGGAGGVSCLLHHHKHAIPVTSCCLALQSGAAEAVMAAQLGMAQQAAAEKKAAHCELCIHAEWPSVCMCLRFSCTLGTHLPHHVLSRASSSRHSSMMWSCGPRRSMTLAHWTDLWRTRSAISRPTAT